MALNSWDKISSIASTLSKDEHSIYLRTSDDEDDKEGVECKDKEECAAIPSAGGNSVCSNDKLFPNISSGIVADYIASERDNNVEMMVVILTVTVISTVTVPRRDPYQMQRFRS